MTEHDFSASSVMDIARKLVGGPVQSVSRLTGGRNSRVYRVDTHDGVFALKQYPSLKDDSRDRFGVEVAALEWMGKRGVDVVPRVLAIDRRHNSALLSWLEGSRVHEVTISDIDQAVEFLAILGGIQNTTSFPSTHLASEACLSGEEIERQIRKRAVDLGKVEGEPALQEFLTEEFSGALENCVVTARERRSLAGRRFDIQLLHPQRSLVPSDFGFHNALKDERGRLSFIDFEYFGWDDPVKLTADVLLHPGTPVAPGLRSRFRAAAEELYGGDPDFVTRLAAFLPLFGLRWVLILLNEFHPERWRRRILAGASNGWAEAKDRQLRAARAMLANLRG